MKNCGRCGARMVSWTQFTVSRAVCDGQMETPPVGLLCIDVCSDCAKGINLLKEFARKRQSVDAMAREPGMVWDGTLGRFVYES